MSLTSDEMANNTHYLLLRKIVKNVHELHVLVGFQIDNSFVHGNNPGIVIDKYACSL